MAGLYNVNEKISKVSVLDAGAGSGILSCAFIERLETIDSIKEIELACKENWNIFTFLLAEIRFLTRKVCYRKQLLLK